MLTNQILNDTGKQWFNITCDQGLHQLDQQADTGDSYYAIIRLHKQLFAHDECIKILNANKNWCKTDKRNTKNSKRHLVLTEWKVL